MEVHDSCAYIPETFKPVISIEDPITYNPYIDESIWIPEVV